MIIAVGSLILDERKELNLALLEDVGDTEILVILSVRESASVNSDSGVIKRVRSGKKYP
ncbi:MAG TPA: hypothetical protein VIJ25_11970 [Methylococcales bacterium]